MFRTIIGFDKKKLGKTMSIKGVKKEIIIVNLYKVLSLIFLLIFIAVKIIMAKSVIQAF